MKIFCGTKGKTSSQRREEEQNDFLSLQENIIIVIIGNHRRVLFLIPVLLFSLSSPSQETQRPFLAENFSFFLVKKIVSTGPNITRRASYPPSRTRRRNLHVSPRSSLHSPSLSPWLCVCLRSSAAYVLADQITLLMPRVVCWRREEGGNYKRDTRIVSSDVCSVLEYKHVWSTWFSIPIRKDCSSVSACFRAPACRTYDEQKRRLVSKTM